MPLREDEVIRAVAQWFRDRDYKVAHLQGTQRGIDIDAIHASGERWNIEAKGGHSSGKDHSNRAFASVSAAFLTAVAWSEDEARQGTKLAIALPKSPWFEKQTSRITRTLAEKDIGIFWVDDDGRVVTTGLERPHP